MAPGDNIFINLESLLEFRQKIMDGKYPSLKRRAVMMAMLDERIEYLQKEIMEVMGYFESIENVEPGKPIRIIPRPKPVQRGGHTMARIRKALNL